MIFERQLVYTIRKSKNDPARLQIFTNLTAPVKRYPLSFRALAMNISKISPSTSLDSSDDDAPKVKAFMDILHPVIRINQFFGLCPLEISGYNLKLRSKSFKTVHAVFTLCILTTYLIYCVYQLVRSFGRGRSVPEIVTMATWVAATIIPITMLVLTILKRDQFSHFFEKSNEFRVPLKGMIKCDETQNYAHKLFTVYIFLTLGSCVFVTMDVIRKPTMDVFLLAYTKDPPPGLVAISCIFQCYLVILKSCAGAFIEVLCCCIGASFQNTVTSIIDEMHGIVGVSKSPIYRQHKSSVEQNNILREQQQQQQRQRRHAVVDLQSQQLNLTGFPGDKDNHSDDLTRIPSIPKFTYSGYSDLTTTYPSTPVHKYYKLQEDFTTTTFSYLNDFEAKYSILTPKTVLDGAAPILRAIKKFGCISSMQSLLNCIFGTILALDVALLVLVSCLLLYLKINYLQGSGGVHYVQGISFVGNCTLYFARLIIVFISLGNVHEMSIHFNDCVTASLMHVRNPQPPEINLVVAHLTSQFANPSCFNAAGFFIFSRGSLLAVLSAIMTYVIFLLQAKM